MELKQIKALQTIVSTGTFSEAAKRLHLTQSALSHQIRNLEDELGEALLVRSRPRVYPTPAGNMVLSAAERILAEITGLKQQFKAASAGDIVGNLRVASTKLGLVYLFGDLCDAFIARYPKVELVVRATENSGEAVRRVVDGMADVAWTPFPIGTAQVDAVVLGRAEYVFIVAQNHPLAGEIYTTVEEIAESPLVLFEKGSGTRDVSDEIFSRVSRYPKIVTESNDTEFVKRIVAIGAGVALIPAFALTTEVTTGELSMLRLKGRRLMVDFGIVHRRGTKMLSVDHFRDLCLEMRGPKKVNVTMETAGKPAFRISKAP